MSATTASGFETYTAWLPCTSLTVAPARLDMARWASGGIIRSAVATRYQLGLLLHAASVTAPSRALTPQGSWELAMKSALSFGRSAAKEAANLALSSSRYPSCGGRMGGTGVPGAGFLISTATDSP